jgi:hypothetical protein
VYEPSEFTLNFFVKNCDIYSEYNLEIVKNIVKGMGAGL